MRHPQTHRAFLDLLLVFFCLAYGLLHWLVAFPVWDRYLLPLMPVLALLLARIVADATLLWRSVRGGRGVTVGALILALLLTLPAHQASAGRSHVTAERAGYEGVEQVLAFLHDLPEGSVVYHHWLGWHYHYALFDGPVYLAYWPTPSWLARDVKVFGESDPRYIAFPGWESVARVEDALQAVGYGLDQVLSVTDGKGRQAFAVYHITASSAR